MSPYANSNLNLKEDNMISTYNSHNLMFFISYVTGLKNIFKTYISVSKRRHHKNHNILRASMLLLQITSANIYPVISVCNSLNSSQFLPKIFNIVAWMTYLNFIYSMVQVFPDKLNLSHLVKKFPAFYWNRRFINAFTKAQHLSLYWAPFNDCNQK
jgi:hypothetical protein